MAGTQQGGLVKPPFPSHPPPYYNDEDASDRSDSPVYENLEEAGISSTFSNNTSYENLEVDGHATSPTLPLRNTNNGSDQRHAFYENIGGVTRPLSNSVTQYPIDNRIADQRPNMLYENVRFRPLPQSSETPGIGLHDPHQQQVSPVDVNAYPDPAQRHELSPHFSRNPSNSFSSGTYGLPTGFTDRLPHPHPLVYEGWMSVPPPERPVTPTGQRRSLDETHTRQLMQQHAATVTPAAQTTPFVRQHRRGRSDEVSRCFEGIPEARHPIRFGSPPPTRSNYSMHLSRSTTSLDNERPASVGYGHIGPGLIHTSSVDSTHMFTNTDVNQVLYKQNIAYIKLQTAINLSQDKFKKSKKEVKKLEKELMKSLAVQKNPTEKEYRQLKEEITILHREITEMYGECDKLGISTDASAPQIPPQPPTPYLHTPSPTKPPSGGRYVEQGFQYPGYGVDNHAPPSYNSLSVMNKTPPPYNTLPYNEPDVPNLFRSLPAHNKQPTAHNKQPTAQPPVRPPPPAPHKLHDCATAGALETDNDGDHWKCPSCTFLNLLVVECEVCNTPRPRDHFNAIRHP